MPFRKLGEPFAKLATPIGSPRGGGVVPFVPTDIPGLLFWLTADLGLFQDSLATVPADADNDPVGAWEDQSGNNNDVAQTVAGERPLLKTAILGGKNVVRFASASSQHLFALSAFLTGGSGSFFVTLQETTISNNQNILAETDKDVAGNDVVAFQAVWSTGAGNENPFIRANAGGAGFNINRTDLDIVAATALLWAFRSDGAAYTIRQDGVNLALTTVAGVDNGDWFDTIVAPDTVTVGARIISTGDNQHFNGDMRQLLVYDSNLTGDDLANVEAFLADDIGIVLP